ncbi:hypothetical protein LCGC14_1948690, partial [marine sediment metagenome]
REHQAVDRICDAIMVGFEIPELRSD